MLVENNTRNDRENPVTDEDMFLLYLSHNINIITIQSNLLLQPQSSHHLAQKNSLY